MTLHLNLAAPVHLLVLIGGGEFSFGETRTIDEFLIRNMPQDRRRVAFLPTASGSADYAMHLGNYFKQIDASIETVNVPIYRGRDSRREKNLAAIRSAGMVYLGGGVTNNLLATIRDSAALTAMSEAAQSGAVIAAIGAAASCFGVHVRDMRGVAPALDGLRWIDRTVVDTAFDPTNDQALRRLMSLPDTDVGLGIPPETALAIRASGETDLLGDGTIAVFRKPSGV